MSKEIPKFKFQMRDKVVESDLDIILDVDISDPNEIANRLFELPSNYAYWGMIWDWSVSIYDKLEFEYELWWNSLYEQAKADLREKYTKSEITESLVKATIINSNKEEYTNRRKALMEAKYRCSVLKKVEKILSFTKDSWGYGLSWRKAEIK